VASRSPLATAPRRFVARALPFLVLGVLLSIAFQAHGPWLIPLHLAAFFLAALTCHDALARGRPPARDLTAFYVWMSFGGMLGGGFNTLVAPVIFTGVFEYPIVLALACLVRLSPGYRRARLEPWGLFVATSVVPLVACAGFWSAGLTPAGVSLGVVLIIAAIIPAALTAAANRLAPFNALAALAVAGLIVAANSRSASGNVVFAGRSFFGVLRVIEAADHSHRLLQHGTTLHGRQNLPAGPRCQPQSYYDAAGPVGDLFERSGRRFTEVAVVGLGSGGLACYAEPGARWTFFEIDPLVERIARDPSLFTFLPTSRGRIEIVIGDGRKRIEAVAAGSFDLIVLDAFSSDSVPVHLLTEEAIAEYLVRLRPGGIIALHISNRYLDLEPVIAALAAAQRLPALTEEDLDIPQAELLRGRTPSQWVALAGSLEPLARLGAGTGWRPLVARQGVRAWTDDYSNLLRSIRWR
jgi:SAM-dependent methyltransferase